MKIWVLEMGEYGSMESCFFGAFTTIDNAKYYLSQILRETEHVSEWNMDEDGDLEATLTTNGKARRASIYITAHKLDAGM